MTDELRKLDESITQLRQALEMDSRQTDTILRPTSFELERLVLERSGWVDLVVMAALVDQQFAAETYKRAAQILQQGREEADIPDDATTE